MQPYFFPYVGYFELIAQTDMWVVFDVVQYCRKSWMNRNRILHPNNGWQYVGVSVQKASRETLIKDIQVKDRGMVLQKILGQLQHYRKNAPYFCEVVDLVNRAFSSVNSNRLVDLNVSALTEVCVYIGIPFNWSLCSEMDIELNNVKHSGQWALRISEQLGANTYLNPPSGKAIFQPIEWENAGIELKFTELLDFTYKCKPYDFIAHLSVLDVLMWNDPKRIQGIVARTP